MSQSQVVQALRLKGRATAEEIANSLGTDVAQVENELSVLAEGIFAVERLTGRRPGWMLTGEGRDLYESVLSESRTPEVVSRLSETYEDFLKFNQHVKDLCAKWQATADDAIRFEILEGLAEICDKVAPSLTSAGQTVARFSAYPNRLASALARAHDDPRHVVSPSVESYHTIWFECHEDYLLTLGRSRIEEGSW